MSLEPTRFFRPLAALACVASLTAAPGLGAEDRGLRLRLSDAHAEPGGIAAIVLRTYASQTLGAGQVCFEARSATGAPSSEGPFVGLESVEVFSQARDALGLASIEAIDGGQRILLSFESTSASVNNVEGPLAVLYFRVRDSVQPGQRFNLSLDDAQSMAFAADGRTIPFEGRSGRLKIRSPGARFQVEADGDKLAPGETAELGISTFAPVPLSAGRIALRWNRAIAVGEPSIAMDRRHGRRSYQVEVAEPGLLIVTFESSNATFNTVPGDILQVTLRTSAAATPGTRSRLRIVRSQTELLDADGVPLKLKLKKDWIEFE